MSIYGQIIDLINILFIKGIFISVLIIICSRLLFKRVDTKNALLIIRWLLLSYSILVIVQLLITLLHPESSKAFWERATDRYRFAFWLMISSPLLPLFLFVKSLRNNIYILLFMAIWINIGWHMESLVIHLTMMNREYSGNSNSSPSTGEVMIILKGILIGVLILAIGNSYIWIKKASHEN